MNILFMSLTNYKTIYIHSLYPDLLRQFVRQGDSIYVISPIERHETEKEHVIRENGVSIIKLRIWNMQKTNIAEKAISMLTIDKIFIKGIKKYLSDIRFDLVIYPTPPITLLKAVEYVKKRDGARTYLLLKDIFPQNAVDIGLMSISGLKSIPYKYFRSKEKKMYRISDSIGCMSEANVEYVLNHNPEVNSRKIEVCPNSYDPLDMSCSDEDRIEIRTKYGIPINKTVFIYGGNLGKPQGIPFVIECLKKCKCIEEAFFLIVGDGTEYARLERFINEDKPQNVKLMKRLPKEDYDMMVAACDVGLIFLDHRFTIPNFPSRLLSYMQAKIPVLACTDPSTDIGKVIVDGGFGWWCESNDSDGFITLIDNILNLNIQLMANKEWDYLCQHYSSERSYDIIMKGLKDE